MQNSKYVPVAALCAIFLFAAYIVMVFPVLPPAFAELASVGIEVNTLTTVAVSGTPMNFALDPGVEDENGSGDTPFTLDNNGTVDLDVVVCGVAIAWSGTTDTNTYKFVVSNKDAGACTTVMTTDYNTMPYPGDAAKQICQGLQFGQSEDEIYVGIKIKSPVDEPETTSTTSTVTFTVAQDTYGDGINDANKTC